MINVTLIRHNQLNVMAAEKESQSTQQKVVHSEQKLREVEASNQIKVVELEDF